MSFAHCTRTCLYNYTHPRTHARTQLSWFNSTHIDGIIRLILYLTTNIPYLSYFITNLNPYSYIATSHPNQPLLTPPLSFPETPPTKTPNRVF